MARSNLYCWFACSSFWITNDLSPLPFLPVLLKLGATGRCAGWFFHPSFPCGLSHPAHLNNLLVLMGQVAFPSHGYALGTLVAMTSLTSSHPSAQCVLCKVRWHCIIYDAVSNTIRRRGGYKAIITEEGVDTVPYFGGNHGSRVWKSLKLKKVYLPRNRTS